jgi:hypothetical protein
MDIRDSASSKLSGAKDSRLRHAASHGLPLGVTPSSQQEATIAQAKEDFRVTAARLIARLDEQDSKNPESERSVKAPRVL